VQSNPAWRAPFGSFCCIVSISFSFTNNTPMINCCELGKINNSLDFQDYETKAGASVVVFGIYQIRCR
jgi:hypothetical protein